MSCPPFVAVIFALVLQGYDSDLYDSSLATVTIHEKIEVLMCLMYT